MLIMTVWLSLAFESNEPISVKRDRRSDVAAWIVSVGWVVLLFFNPAPDGRKLWPKPERIPARESFSVSELTVTTGL